MALFKRDRHVVGLMKQQAKIEQIKDDKNNFIYKPLYRVCQAPNCRKKGEKFGYCGACKSIYYCSRKCQLNDFKRHEQTCGENTCSCNHVICNKFIYKNVPTVYIDSYIHSRWIAYGGEFNGWMAVFVSDTQILHDEWFVQPKTKKQKKEYAARFNIFFPVLTRSKKLNPSVFADIIRANQTKATDRQIPVLILMLTSVHVRKYIYEEESLPFINETTSQILK